NRYIIGHFSPYFGPSGQARKHITSTLRRKPRRSVLVVLAALERGELGERSRFRLVQGEVERLKRFAFPAGIGIERQSEGFQQQGAEVNLGAIDMVGKILVLEVDEHFRARRRPRVIAR